MQWHPTCVDLRSLWDFGFGSLEPMVGDTESYTNHNLQLICRHESYLMSKFSGRQSRLKLTVQNECVEERFNLLGTPPPCILELPVFLQRTRAFSRETLLSSPHLVGAFQGVQYLISRKNLPDRTV